MAYTPNLTLKGGGFTDFEGNPLASGYLLLALSHDASYSIGPNQIVGGLKLTIALDANGNIPVSPAVLVYSNDVLTPSGSVYYVRAFKADGTEAWASPQIWTLTASPNPLDVGTIVPASPPGAGLGGGGLTLLLETNSTVNTNQSLLNIVNGTNVTITNSAGVTTINATGGPSFSGSGSFMFGPGLRDVASVLGGNWGAPFANSVNGSKTGNQVIVYLFQLDVAMTISKVSTQCTNNSIGPTASFGIYSFAGSKLVDGGSFTLLMSSGVQTNSITPVTLQPGVYWHAQACSTNAAGATFSGILVATQPSSQSLPIYVKNATRSGTAANAMSGGVLPATLGTITTFTPTVGGADGVVCPLYE